MDLAGIRTSPFCFSHSDSGPRSSTSGNRQRLSSGASRISSRSDQGTGATDVRVGHFVDRIPSDISRYRQIIFRRGLDCGNLDGVSLLRGGTLSCSFQPFGHKVYSAAETGALLPSLHEQQAMFRGDIPFVGLRISNHGTAAISLIEEVGPRSFGL